ncbi:MAG: thioredoxin [Spirochaetales bacterium]|nr:thioredoxin [Spirochaetales bacterium]
MSAEVNLTSGNFKTEVLDSPIPVLVDFWAEWCGPCRMIAPSVAQLAEQYSGKLKVAKLDVDAEPDLAGQYGITSIPSLLVFKGGEVVSQRVGALPKAAIEDMFKKEI